MALTAAVEATTTSCGAERATEVAIPARPATRNDIELYGSDFEPTTPTEFIMVDNGVCPPAASPVAEFPKESKAQLVPTGGVHELTSVMPTQPRRIQEGHAQSSMESDVDESMEEKVGDDKIVETINNQGGIDGNGNDRTAFGPFKRIEEHGAYMRSMEQRVAYLEADLQVRGGKNSKPQSQPKRIPAVPKLHRVNWLEFKNKVVDDKQFAVEVLYGGAKYYYQRNKDIHKGRNAALEASRLSQSKSMSDHNVLGLSIAASLREGPDRIRINSMPLSKILGGLFDLEWTMDSLVIIHPFKMLVYWEEEIKATLLNLEHKWAFHEKEELLRQADGPPSDVSSYGQVSEESKVSSTPENLRDSLEALRDLRCLVQFMEEDLEPLSKSFLDSTCRKIRFRDLWYLYKPGDELIAPISQRSDNVNRTPGYRGAFNEMTVPPGSHPYRYQTAWRVLQVADGQPCLRPLNDIDSFPPPRDTQAAFILQCYYVEYDGTRFGPIIHNFSIAPYEGERDITSLEVFPLRFANMALEMKNDLKKRGERFVECTAFRQSYYKGDTIEGHPSGLSVVGEVLPRRSEYLESQVVIDFKETLERYPNWVPRFGRIVDLPTSWDDRLPEKYPVRYWRSYDQEMPELELFELIQADHLIDLKMMDEHILAEPLLKSDHWITNRSQLHDDLLFLLPTRVFGFVLSTRKFSLLNIENLQPLKPHEESFDSLKLPPGHRRTIEALVKSHFAKPEDRYHHDFIRGKDKGLTILLHGAVGVGKTATAECVAESTGRLVLSITTADLTDSTDSEDYELEKDLRLAEKWGLFLLLDDVDELFSRWRPLDNSVHAQSVLLRLLDQYTGVVFMTTSDLGALDKAVQSRAHFSLHYPPLDGKQSYEIWKMNIDRLEARKTMLVDKAGILDFARSKFYKLRGRVNESWNGKEIRNAFRTAVALAEYDATQGNVNANDKFARCAPVLKREHFQGLNGRVHDFNDFKPRIRRYISCSDTEYSSDDEHIIDIKSKRAPKPAPPPVPAYNSQYGAFPGFSFPSYQQGLHPIPLDAGDAPPHPPHPAVLTYPPLNPSIHHPGNPGHLPPPDPFVPAAPTTGLFTNSAPAPSSGPLGPMPAANTFFAPTFPAPPHPTTQYPDGTIGHFPDGKTFVPFAHLPLHTDAANHHVFHPPPPPPPPLPVHITAPPPVLRPRRRSLNASEDRDWPEPSAGVGPDHGSGRIPRGPRHFTRW